MTKYAILALSVLCVVLGLSTVQYRRMFKATDFALTTQNAAIESQKKQAQGLYDELKARADELQTQLNKRAEAQEKTDETGKAAVAADDAAHRDAPVRVRYVSTGCGTGGGGAKGGGPAAAQAGTGNAGTASGVLPKESARRLADALTEIETMSLAYASCRATLVKE